MHNEEGEENETISEKAQEEEKQKEVKKEIKSSIPLERLDEFLPILCISQNLTREEIPRINLFEAQARNPTQNYENGLFQCPSQGHIQLHDQIQVQNFTQRDHNDKEDHSENCPVNQPQNIISLRQSDPQSIHQEGKKRKSSQYYEKNPSRRGWFFRLNGENEQEKRSAILSQQTTDKKPFQNLCRWVFFNSKEEEYRVGFIEQKSLQWMMKQPFIDKTSVKNAEDIFKTLDQITTAHPDYQLLYPSASVINESQQSKSSTKSSTKKQGEKKSIQRKKKGFEEKEKREKEKKEDKNNDNDNDNVLNQYQQQKSKESQQKSLKKKKDKEEKHVNKKKSVPKKKQESEEEKDDDGDDDEEDDDEENGDNQLVKEANIDQEKDFDLAMETEENNNVAVDSENMVHNIEFHDVAVQAEPEDKERAVAEAGAAIYETKKEKQFAEKEKQLIQKEKEIHLFMENEENKEIEVLLDLLKDLANGIKLYQLFENVVIARGKGDFLPSFVFAKYYCLLLQKHQSTLGKRSNDHSQRSSYENLCRKRRGDNNIQEIVSRQHSHSKVLEEESDDDEEEGNGNGNLRHEQPNGNQKKHVRSEDSGKRSKQMDKL